MTQLIASRAPTRPTRRPRKPTAPLPRIGRAAPPRWCEEPGARFVLAEVALVATSLLTGVLAPVDLVRLVALGAVVLASAAVLPSGAGLGVALSAWALWTGFVEHRFGQLTLAPADLARVAVLVGVAVTGTVIRRSWGAGRPRG